MFSSSFLKRKLAFSPYTSTTRYIGLDLLRALAVGGVILCHSHVMLPFSFSGWAGVDLFFVLSGFLVTGLLITEYQQRKDINRIRFFIRRSFKILPPFYILVLVGSVYHFYTTGALPSIKLLIIELGFLQSYYEGLWGHTWTLAVEEQFYLFLLLLFSILLSYKLLDKPKVALTLLLILLLIVWSCRLLYSLEHRDLGIVPMFTTHTRADGLLVGTICAFLYHYYPGFRAFLQHHKRWWAIVALSCIAPVFYLPGGSFAMNTWGLCLLHVGFAIAVLLSLNIQLTAFSSRTSWLVPGLKAAAAIGFHSYSIYLWHGIVRDITYAAVSNENLATVIYIFFSLVVGIIMSVLVEQRFLTLRNKLFPHKNSASLPTQTNMKVLPPVRFPFVGKANANT